MLPFDVVNIINTIEKYNQNWTWTRVKSSQPRHGPAGQDQTNLDQEDIPEKT